MTRWARSLMIRLRGSTPRSRSCSISRTSTRGSATTPLPMMQATCGWRMPLGMSWNLNSPCSVTTVCPALLPPWALITMSACSARKSTSLPLPSSPHCPPTITMTTAGYLTDFDGRVSDTVDEMRCAWAGEDPLLVARHDDGGGLPVLDDRTLFEFLTLAGALAGLRWMMILRPRDAFRNAFGGF